MLSLRVLLIGRARGATGLARVLRTIGSGLASRGHDITILSPVDGELRESGYQLIEPTNPHDLYGLDDVAAVHGESRWDAILVMYDPTTAARFVDRLRTCQPLNRLFAYIPIDGAIADEGAIWRLASHCKVIPYTTVAANMFRECLAPVALSEQVVAPIPHGVDLDAFYPIGREERDSVRAALFPANGTHESLIFLNANRNDERKQLAKTVAGFVQLAKHHDNVYLVLHSSPNGALYLGDLPRRIGLEHRLILTSGISGGSPLNDEALNRLYNACDVGINTSQCEGWGLVAFEHAATGAPQIMFRSALNREVWGDAACYPASETVDDLVALMKTILDTRIKAELSDVALVHARRPDGSWRNVISAWERLLVGTATGP